MNSAVYFPNESFFQRKKYVQRSGVIDSGRLYESALTALIALRATFDDNVLDMWIASNGNRLGAFRNLILSVEHKFLGKRIFVMQMKHKENYTIVKSSFTNPKESFYLNKYVEDYKTIKKGLSDGDKYLVDFFENVKFDDVRFVLYTNSDFKEDTGEFPIGDLVTLKRVPHRDLLNTGKDGGCVYEIDGDEELYSKFYFYTRQARVEDVESLIYSEINDAFGEVDAKIGEDVIAFFDSWARGDLNGHYKLTKDELKMKLFELLITPHVVQPRFCKEFVETQIWAKILHEADVVIVEETTPIFTSYMYFVLEKIVDKFYGETLDMDVDNWTARFTADLTARIEKNLDIKRAFCALFGQNVLTCKSFYMMLWRIGIIPLVVDVSEARLNSILKRINMDENYKLKLIILGNRYAKMQALRFYKTFVNLSDLSRDVSIEISNNIMVSLQGRQTVPLSEFIKVDGDILKFIDAATLLKMSTEETCKNASRDTSIDLTCNIPGQTMPLREFIKPDCELQFIDAATSLKMSTEETATGTKIAAPKLYINRFLLKPVLRIDILRRASGHVFIITGCAPSLNDIKSKFIVTNFDDLIDFKATKNAIICEPNLPLYDYDSMLETYKYKAVHHLHYSSLYPGCLEWKQTWGKVKQLFEFVIKTPDMNDLKISQEEVLSYNEHKVNIICADPGMGKSTFVSNLARMPTTSWILSINLNKFTADLNENFENPLDYFYAKTETTRRNFTDGIFSVLKSTKRIKILLDGFDEISPVYTDKMIQIIKWFQINGYTIWITTRPTMKTFLESSFNVLSYTLQRFTVDDINEYLLKHRKMDINEMNIDNIEFMSNPLHLKMASNYMLDSSNRSIVDLYENFIDQKLETYWKKSRCDDTNIIIIDETLEKNLQFKKMHQLISLKLFFDDDLLVGITKLTKINKFLRNIRLGKNNIGIIVDVTDDLKPIFGHRTYAEYLTGKWLAENVREVKKLLPYLFKQHFVFIKEIFDRILAKESKLHTEILNRNVDYVKEFAHAGADDDDSVGRTPLHLAASLGKRHSYANSILINEEQHYIDVNDECEQIFTILLENGSNPFEKDKLMEWNAYDYASNTCSLSLLELLYSRGYKHKLQSTMPVESLVYYCSTYNYFNIATHLDNYPNIKTYKNERNALHLASRNGNVTILRFMLSKNDFKNAINETDVYGNGALHYAAEKGHNDCLVVLLDDGADANLKNSSGESPIALAALNGRAETITHLTLKKANVGILDAANRSPLHYAAVGGHFCCVRLLIRRGLDVNAKDVEDWTPLLLAVERGHADVAGYLLSQGADINQGNKHGVTALHLAARYGHLQCLNLLLKYNTTKGIFHFGVRTGGPVAYVIHLKTMDSVDVNGRTALDLALQNGHSSCVDALLLSKVGKTVQV